MASDNGDGPFTIKHSWWKIKECHITDSVPKSRHDSWGPEISGWPAYRPTTEISFLRLRCFVQELGVISLVLAYVFIQTYWWYSTMCKLMEI